MSSIDRLRAQLGDLADVALSALPEMFDQDSGLFSHKTVVVNGSYVNHEPNVLYSTVSLVGLLEQRRRPADRVLELGRALDGAHAAVAVRGRPGELGNLVWASVLSEDRRGEKMLSVGQWWWLYSTRARSVVEGYPVYSVHQDGMAFLGLVELERLGVGTYADALALGLDWLTGKNELGVDLVGRDPAFINRCIQRDGSDADGIYGLPRSGYARAIGRSLAPVVGRDRIEEDRRGFEVLRECRSYHLGWLLYAHALVERAAAAADAST